MPIFTAVEKYNEVDYTIKAWERNGEWQFRCDTLGTTEFPSFEKLEAAIKAKDLADRKGFKNPRAFVKRWSYRDDDFNPVAVTVTSLRDEKSAYVKYNHSKERGVELLENIYADEQQLKEYSKLLRQQQTESNKAKAALTMWKPIH